MGRPVDSAPLRAGNTKAAPLRAGRIVSSFGVVIAGFVAALVVLLRGQAMVRAGLVGFDLTAFQSFAQRWLDTGSMYLPFQLAGRFDPQLMVDGQLPSMYPPVAVLWFLPTLVLPAVLWWTVPLGILAYAFVRWRPVQWAWAYLFVVFIFTDALALVIAGSTTIWVAAFVAAGLLWHWPSALVVLKPSLLPFALIGARRRSWWAMIAAIAVIALPFAGQWLDYARVVGNAETSVIYSLGSVPLLVTPVVAWTTRRGITRCRPSGP